MATPEPVAKETVCSLCGLDWDKHPKKKSLTAEDCVKLLKAELARRPNPIVWQGTTTYPLQNYAGNVQ